MIKRILKKLKYIKVYVNIKKKISKIKSLNRKIRVLFYVCENQKWCYQSLYDELDKNPNFEPFVIVSLLNCVHNQKDKTRNNLEENYAFFKSRGMKVEYGYKDGTYIDLKTFEPDIVFYEQKWELPKTHKPRTVSKYALTCACPYSFQIFQNLKENYSEFYSFLFRYFVTCEQNKTEIISKNNCPLKNIYVSGYPKLDVYNKKNEIDLNLYWKHTNKFKIIYAPHHSFAENSLKLSTFRENGEVILDWAKKHSDNVTWVFKPHPAFQYQLLKNKIMTKDEIEEYYSNWEKVGNIYTQGDYFDIFKTSDLMITDCGSFLAEYLPVNKPLIRPVNKNSIELNEVGKLVVSAYYQTYNNCELINTLEKIVIEKDDYMFEKRNSVANELFDFNKSAASKIIENIETEIYKGVKND